MPDKLNLELLLRDLYEAMSELSLVLDSEHKALTSQDVEQLQQAAVNKELLSDRIEQLEKNRCGILQALGLGKDLAAMKQLISRSSAHDEDALYKLWNLVAELTRECTAKNKLNGVIIEAKRRQTVAALSILHGHQPGNTELYDADGATVATKNNSTIARA